MNLKFSSANFGSNFLSISKMLRK